MSISEELRIDVDWGTGYELLVQLSQAGDDPRLGAEQGELWLHLVGLVLEAEPPRDGAALVAAIARTPPGELLRHALGLHVPAWRRYVDGGTIEAAIAGDAAAQDVLLAPSRYYAGAARGTLRRLLDLGPAQAKALLLDVVSAWRREALAPREQALAAELERHARTAEAELGEGLEYAARGYRHDPEPGIDRILIVPQLEAADRLLLLQHRSARVVLFGAGERSLAASLKALADEQRLGLLRRLGRAPATLQELADELAVPRTSLHHHLSLLRDAGYLALVRRPDRTYEYEVRPQALERAGREVAAIAGGP